MRLNRLAITLLSAAALAGCSRANNILEGRVEAVVAGHPVVVTDCYRTSAPQPRQDGAAMRFTPCKDADVVIRAGQLTVNGKDYGTLAANARVVVDHGKVSIEK